MSLIIPTSYKSKLPHLLSYPIGAEAISESLKDVPQIAQLKLSFHAHHRTELVSNAIKQLVNQKPYEIFSAVFQHLPPGLTASNEFIAEGWYEERWELTVYALPRTFKAAARKALLEEGLPKIAVWLSAPRTETWKYGRKFCRILFSEQNGEIEVQEGNDR